MVTILGPDGRPIKRATLSQEVAAPTVMGVRATHHEAVAAGLKPERLVAILRQAQLGNARDYLTLAEEMEERYLHYASQVQTRRLAVEGITPTVQVPDGTDTRIVDAVHALVEDAGLLDAIGDLTDGVAKGYAVVEPMWEYQGGLLRPVEYKSRDQRYFCFDRVSQRELRLARDGSLDGDPIDKPAFIAHQPRAKAGLPIRRGFARAAAWAFLLQSFALKDWAAFAEIYGVPLRLGRYHPAASNADKRALLRAVSSIASDAAAIVPQGMDIEFVEVDGSKGEAVFGGLLDYLDKQVSKLVVGQTMTADDGASMAQAKIHDKVRLDILQADCRQLAHTLNRDLLRWFVSFNFGPQDAYPQIALPVPEPEDIKELTEGVARLVPYGLKVGQREMRGKLGLSEPEDDEDLLVPAAAAPAQAPAQDAAEAPAKAPGKTPGKAPGKGPARLSASHGAGCGCAGCRAYAGLAADDGALDVDAELERLLAAETGDWEALTDPILAPLREALAQATSFEDLIAKLPEVARKGGGDRLAERLARLAAIARGLGDVAD